MGRGFSLLSWLHGDGGIMGRVAHCDSWGGLVELCDWHCALSFFCVLEVCRVLVGGVRVV